MAFISLSKHYSHNVQALLSHIMSTVHIDMQAHTRLLDSYLEHYMLIKILSSSFKLNTKEQESLEE